LSFNFYENIIFHGALI